MKTSFYILIVMLFAFSCNSDDDAQQNPEPTLNGSWSLVNVSGGLAGVDDDFETGLIIWNFNTNTSEVTVTNTNTTDVIYDGFPSGTYDYELLPPTEEGASIIINSFNYSITTLSSTQLVLDEGVGFDGFLLTFSR